MLQAHYISVSKIIAVMLDVFNACAAPAINGLVVITHGKNMSVFSSQHANPGVLYRVGILEFINQNMTESLAIMIQQARMFQDAVQVSGLFLAKLDGTAKGGIVLAIRDQLDIPVKFVGLGEKPPDIAIFDPEKFVSALF